VYNQTTLWKRAFESPTKPPSAKDLRDRFRTVLLSMRERAGMLVQEIPKDVPGLTIHDLTHLDALWELADLVAGKAVTLNPAEGFVFGASVLLHDAALSVAAYPHRMEDLRKTPEWREYVELERRSLVRQPGAPMPDTLPERNEKAVVWRVLRERHAKMAYRLADQKWVWGDKEGYLIEDSELRDAYSELIGSIASSHHWPVADLPARFETIRGALPTGPAQWTVRPLLLACLLRIADALHIDSRRAPRFAYLLNQPAGTSKLHWDFQNKVLKPRVNDASGNVEFTSSAAFGAEEADAWWLCYDWVRMCGRELRECHEILDAGAMPRLRSRDVEGVSTAKVFSQFVRVKGWEPIESALRVSDVSGLVRSLGGRALYGNKPELALRELVQNAADAVRARAALQPGYHGQVVIRIRSGDDGTWLSVEDNGVGMSAHTLTTMLLDFGNSFWNSETVIREFPGLVARGFRSGGRFGIGFFSVFMLGDYVTVTSRRYDRGFDETRRLEFRAGLELRPILLEAPGAQLPAGGTRVDVRLRPEVVPKLSQANVKKMFPALSVSLAMSENDGPAVEVIAAHDWLTITPRALFQRLGIREDPDTYPLTLIQDEHGIYGRAAVKHHGASSQDGAIVDELGIRISRSEFMAGIVRGTPIDAARSQAAALVPPAALAAWATAQAKALATVPIDNSEKIDAATQVLCAGGSLENLPFLSTKGKLVTVDDFRELVRDADEFWLFFESYFNQPADAEIGKVGSRWHTWYHERLVFRAAPFFSNTEQPLLAISGVRRENIWDNPITALVRRVASEVWKCDTTDGRDGLEKKIPPARYYDEREGREFILRIAKVKPS
jgi:hypothetical protein